MASSGVAPYAFDGWNVGRAVRFAENQMSRTALVLGTPQTGIEALRVALSLHPILASESQPHSHTAT